jgi:molybdenum cofactor guanylyltransferase
VSADLQPAPPGDVTAVVLAGGTSRRFGSDKLVAPFRGSTVLESVVGTLPGEWPVVVVGPVRDCGRAVTWVREDPPGGGPLAGVGAGLTRVGTALVAVVAGDMPDAGSALVALVGALRTAPPEVDGVVATDDDGVRNPLLAAYRASAVRGVLPTPAHDRPAKLLLGLAHVDLVVHGSATRDVDTPADLEELRGPP